MEVLTVQATVENMDIVIGFVNQQLSALNCSPGIRHQIDAAVDEIFGNIARYAYPSEAGHCTVSVETGQAPPWVAIRFTDQGIPYDPLSTRAPDITLPPEKRPIGGLGVFMVRKIMDEVKYEFTGGKNTLIIRKRL